MPKRNEHQKDSIDDILGGITGSVDELFGDAELNSVGGGVDAFGNAVGEMPSAPNYEDDDDSVYMDNADELSDLLSGKGAEGAGAKAKTGKKGSGRGQAYGDMGSVDDLFGDMGMADAGADEDGGTEGSEDELAIDDSLFDGDDMGDDEDDANGADGGLDGEDDYYGDLEYPEWLRDIKRKNDASVAHAFLLHGNVRDYIVQNYSLEYGLVDIFDHENSRFDIIAKYDQAHGLSFYGMEDEIADGKTLADIYRARFMTEMEESCTRLSIPVPDDIPNRDTVLLFTILSDMFDHPSHEREAKIMLIIDYSDFLVPDASSAQMKPDERKLAITLADIGRSQVADDAGNIMFFVTDDITQLSGRIKNASSRIEHVKIPIPDQRERAAFIDEVLDDENNVLSDGTQIFAHPDSIDKATFAINSAGLSRMQIEDIMLRALSGDEPLTMRLMKERKQQIIQEDYDDVLEIIDPKTGFEAIGGMDLLKRTFKEEIIEPVHAGEKEAVPMGVLLAGSPGTAKPYASDTVVHMLDSHFNHKMSEISDLQVGDIVFNRYGGPTRVLAVFPRGMKDVYEVVLKDGRKIECSEDHVWATYTHHSSQITERTVHDMLEIGITNQTKDGHNHSTFSIPMNNEVFYPEAELDIDPYVMGCFLGDGCCTLKPLTISSDDPEIPQEIARLIGRCSPSRQKHGYNWVFRYDDDLRTELRQAGKINKRQVLLSTKDFFADFPEVMCLAGDKKIPEIYKYASIEQRYALIQGLLDTDGCFHRDERTQFRGNIDFSTTSKQLAEDVREVLFSLGIGSTLTISDRRGTIQHSHGKDYVRKSVMYRININCPNSIKPNLFRLPRKRERAEAVQHIVKGRHYDRVPIVAINKKDEQKDMTCITVSMNDGLFLVGKEYAVGHNTMFSKAVANEAGMNFVALNLNRIMEKWVGSTERNLDRALDCALAMAPTIIFIDEIDEALPNRADPNASSVNKRINQRLLTFFSDTSHRGEVIILAATNYPEKIDPAFKRAGRFDLRIPMFAPDEFDRMRIINVIAASRGFTFSWFKQPDELVENPFKAAGDWVREGNVPVNEHNFVGERVIYTYEAPDSLGNMEKHQVYLPGKFIEILDKERVTRQQVYENIRILFEDMPERKPDAATGAIASDAEFKQQLKNYLAQQTHVLGPMPATQDYLLEFLWDWQTKYGPFSEQTFNMTGAELDVVMNKAITLFRRWKRQKPDKFRKAREAGIIISDNDIPWNFLFDACIANVNATAGIKQMEDMALLNTSDLDFIPDALYGQTDDGRKISYIERHEELVARTAKMTLG